MTMGPLPPGNTQTGQQQLIAQPPPQPGQSPYTYGYYMGLLASHDPQGTRRRRVEDAVLEWGTNDFKRKFDAAWDAINKVTPPPAVRLAVYTTQFDDVRWTELYLKFPRDHDRLWNDFQQLQARAAAGELS